MAHEARYAPPGGRTSHKHPALDKRHQRGMEVAQKSASGAAIGTAECVRCRKRWGGLNTAHCAAESCHQTFTGISAFELHRTGSHTESGETIIDKTTGQPKGPRRCLPPADVGLVDAGRAYPCWGYPGDGTDFWAAQ